MRNERGIALLEVLAALMILGISGLALVQLEAEGLRATADARDRERVAADAERLLTAYTLLERAELDQRLGDRTIGPYMVNVQRPEADLYRIAIARLTTVVYKPEPSGAN